MDSTEFGYPMQLDVDAARTSQVVDGLIHDPIAREISPVSVGHAGVFSTASDLGKLAQFFVSRSGRVEGDSPLSAATRDLMSTLAPGSVRGLGWDFLGIYAGARGENFKAGISFGHTGFTGTTMWIDPSQDRWVVFLSNRVFYGDSNQVSKNGVLRATLSNLASKL